MFAEAEHKNTQAALKRLKKQAGEGNSDYLPIDEVTPDIDPALVLSPYFLMAANSRLL